MQSAFADCCRKKGIIIYLKKHKKAEVIDVRPEIDYLRIGQRIKSVRLEQGLSQSELGKLVGCSNNHMSHVEIGQTKVFLSMLLRISYVLKKGLNYFLLDTPFALRESIINSEIAQKLDKCTSSTLVSVSKVIDILLEQKEALFVKDE